jgi:hypothetical protein
MHFSLGTGLPRPGGAPSFLESQPSFSCAFGNGFNAPVVDEAAPVEYDRVDPSRFRTLANDFTDSARPDTLGCVRAGPVDYFLLQVTGCHQRPPAIIVNHLSINMRG